MHEEEKHDVGETDEDNDDFHLFDKFQLGQSVELDGEEYRIFVIQGLLVVELHLMTESEYKRLTIIQNQE